MRIAVAMSGGINSLLAAILMKRVGYDVLGISADWFCNNRENDGKIRTMDSSLPGNVFSAKRDAKKYNIPHKIIRLEETCLTETGTFPVPERADQFDEDNCGKAVVTLCLIKQVAEAAKTLGCLRLATGHYARIERKSNGLFCVAKGLDRSNDESRQLSLLTQDLLAFCMFPLGEYHWGAVEKMIKQNKLSVI